MFQVYTYNIVISEIKKAIKQRGGKATVKAILKAVDALCIRIADFKPETAKAGKNLICLSLTLPRSPMGWFWFGADIRAIITALALADTLGHDSPDSQFWLDVAEEVESAMRETIATPGLSLGCAA